MKRADALVCLGVGSFLMITSLIPNTPVGYVLLCGIGGMVFSVGAWWLLKQRDTLLEKLVRAYWGAIRNAKTQSKA